MSGPAVKSKLASFLGKYKIIIAFFVLALVISLMTPNFLSWRNIINIFRQSSIIGIMAIGSTFVIIGGGFDISVGSLLALSAAMAVGLQSSMHWFLAVIVVLLVGAAFGAANGFLSSKIHIPPIIATLGTMTIIRGIVYMYTGGYPLYVDSEGFAFIGNGYIGPIPFPIILLLILVALGQFILVKTKFGRYSCAIGGNKEAARLSGIKVDFYMTLTFVAGGVMAAMSGVVYASRLLSVTPLAGQGYELDAIASAVIGGTSVSGGEGFSRENSHRGVVAHDDNQCIQPDRNRSLCSICVQRTCNSGSGWIRFILQGPWLEESASSFDP